MLIYIGKAMIGIVQEKFDLHICISAHFEFVRTVNELKGFFDQYKKDGYKMLSESRRFRHV